MARNIGARLHITGTLVAQTPLHVGGLSADVDTDLPLARDGAGRYYVPGTSFAGAMRAWCSDVFDETTVQDIWGYQEGENGHASWIFVEDAFLPPDSVAAEIRDGVGIDRILGCAAENIKYDRAVLPRGTKLPLVMTVDLAVDKVKENTTREMLAALLAALKNDEVRFGAAQTRGLGRLKLEAAAKVLEHASRRDPGKKPGILALLRGTLPDAQLPTVTHTRPRLVVTIHWHPVGPLMVKSGMDGVGVDMLPLMSGIDGKLAPVLPGSSIKGALRFQAERIVRTVRGLFADPNLSAKDDRFLKHTDVPLVEDVFGSPGRDEKTAKEENKPSHLGRGALGVDDCYAICAVPQDLWQQITLAEAKPNQNHSELLQKLDDPRANLTNWTAAFHVAVDRWTGGAADGFLYSVLEPHGVAWEPMRLELDPKRLPGLEWQGLALLLLILRDLATGRVPLGFATHRGIGAVAIDKIQFSAKDCRDPFLQLDGKTLVKGDLADLPPSLRNELNAIWQKWAPKKEVAL